MPPHEDERRKSLSLKRKEDIFGALAEWLCSGLQIRGPRFDSGTRLHFKMEIGRGVEQLGSSSGS